jgi:hypothetical protein
MPNNHELRREYVLDQAIASGKFGPARRAHWHRQYDLDPSGTEQVLASLASATVGEPPYPRELFPELSRQRSPRARKTAVAATAAPPAPTPPPQDALEAAVAAWTRELFPETAAAGAGPRRVTRCND